MREIQDIIEAFDKIKQTGKQSALATLVHVDGSSYRRPGARMLITEDGELTGAISGGCLEGDALRKALFAMHQQKKMLVTYDTTDEDDAKLGLGLGCNGIIQVLIEPIDPLQKDNPLELLKKLAGTRKNAVLVTLFSLKDTRSTQPGTCLLCTREEMLSVNPDLPIKNIVEEEAGKIIVDKRSVFKNYISGNIDLTVFYEFITPVISLVVFGAGNDVVPLVKMADILGWQVTVMNDGRDKNTKHDRFGKACQLVAVKPEKALSQCTIDERTAFVVMTHNYNYDFAILRELIRKEARYVGMLGPKKKMTRMLDELAAENITVGKEQLSIVYNPIGLDIGAETPEEIALSILAEITAALSGSQGQPLRDKAEGIIHSRDRTRIEVVNLPVK